MKRLVFDPKKKCNVWSEFVQVFSGYGTTCLKNPSDKPISVQIHNQILRGASGRGLYTFPDGVDTGTRVYPNQLQFADVTEIHAVENQMKQQKGEVLDKLKSIGELYQEELDKAKNNISDTPTPSE